MAAARSERWAGVRMSAWSHGYGARVTRAELGAFALTLPVLVAAMVLHELAHGLVANRLGDPTARLLGRLTLNPLRHLDPLGTAMFAITYIGGIAAGIEGFAIGWARPVPVVPGNFRHPQRGMALVALAGPAVNFAVALVFAFVWFHVDLGGSAVLADAVLLTVLVNVVLGVFNLLPVPPLDGSRVIGAFLGRDAWLRWMSFDRYGMFAVIGVVLIFNSQFQAILTPFTDGALRVLATVVGG
jgi:Zn-dependent protease